MADTLRIKRRLAGGAAGAPSALKNAELAYNEQDDTLYYGKGDSGGNATSVIAIGGAGAFQPKDADLTALAALGGTGIYYRSAADTWSLVTIGSGLTFSGGVLSATGGGTGNVSNVGTPLNNQVGVWTGATTIKGDANLTWNGTQLDVLSTDGVRLSGVASQGRVMAIGASASVGLLFADKGGGGHFFYTNGFTNCQVQIGHQTVGGILQLWGGDGSVVGGNLLMNNGNSVRVITPAATSNDTSIATTAFVQRAAVGVGSVRGLTAVTTSGASLTFAANEITLRNSSGGILRFQSIASTAINIGAAVGAGGPDAALSDGDVHFYAISNGSVVAGICSMAAPPTGPTLPSGYTHWTYLFTVKRTSAAFISGGFWVRGNKVHYYGQQIILSGSNSLGAWASLSSAGKVPAIANSVFGFFVGGATSINGSAGMQYFIAPTNGGSHYNIRLDLSAAGWNLFECCAFDLPNISQTIWWFSGVLYSAGNISAVSTDIYVNGYTVPNDS